MTQDQGYQADPTDPNKPKLQSKPVGTAQTPGAPSSVAVDYGTTPASTTAAPPSGNGSIYDTINGLYSKYGVKDNGAGSGFTDLQYWAQHPSEVTNGRLEADLNGTGSDQPTGTPGTGPWSTSGAADRAQGGSGGSGGGLIQFGAPSAAQTGAIGTVNTMDGALGTKDASGLYNTLQARAGQSLKVDPNDPIIKAQVDAYRAEQTRAARNLMSEQAERGGVNSNQDATQRSATEKAAQQTAGFQGQLLSNEVAARRQEIQAALSGQQGILTAQQQMALQQELANLDVKLRSYQFGQSQNQQEAQFARTLAERGFEFDTNSQFQNSPLGS